MNRHKLSISSLLATLIGLSALICTPAMLVASPARQTEPTLVAACLPVLYVNRAAAGANDGSSWANAFLTLQDALAQSALCPEPHEVWVAGGVYYPDDGAGQTNNDRNTIFQLLDGVALYGGFAGNESSRTERDPQANPTVLSGDLGQDDTTDTNGVVIDVANMQGANAYHVVNGGGVTRSAVLDGFVVTAGQADGDFPQNLGGGILIQSGSPVLRDLVVRGNRAALGGGLALGPGSSPTLDRVTFQNNVANFNGGGISMGAAQPSFANVSIVDNRALFGGGMSIDGASDLSLSTVVLHGNRASGDGGGLGVFTSNITLTGVTLSSNEAAGDGGAIFHGGGALTLKNVTVSSNQAGGSGGGLFYFVPAVALNNTVQQTTVSPNAVTANVVTIQNATFSGNRAVSGGAIGHSNGDVQMTNTILAHGATGGNCSGAITSQNYNLSSDSSCTLSQPHDRSNTDPKLAALADNGGATQTHALQEESPAIDSGDCSGGTVTTDQRGVIRPQGLACDIGAYEATGQLLYDYGDAPDPPYPTLKANNGARHGLLTSLRLGATVDAESDGQPNATATGDDNNVDDEDGVSVPAELSRCTVATLTVTTSAAGRLHGWIDFNNDGDWADLGERIFNSVALPAGAQQLPFNVPCHAVLTDATFARFRFTSAVTLTPEGEAFDGEVEDYLVAIRRGPPQAVADAARTAEDTPVVIDVLANDSSSDSALLIDRITRPPANGVATIEAGAIRYTPSSNYHGADSFDYAIRDNATATATATVQVLVTAVNDAPTDIALNNIQVDALASIGDLVGALTTADVDAGDTHTYQLDSDTPGAFAVTGNELRTATLFNPKRKDSYSVRITSTDAANARFEKRFTITIVTRTPVGVADLRLGTARVDENKPAGTGVGLLSATDPRNLPLTFALVGGPGDQHNTLFTIQGNQLRTAATLDFETLSTASIRVQVTNGIDDPHEKAFFVKVIDDPTDTRPPFAACSGNNINLITSPDGRTAVSISQVRITEPTPSSCVVAGKMSVVIPGGSRADDIEFQGRVDKRGRLQSYEAIVGDKIGNFELDPAGINLKLSNVIIEYYGERPSLRIKKAIFCMPADWGGECVPVPAVSWLIDSSGFNFGGLPGAQPPKIPGAKFVSKKGFGVSAIFGNFKRVATGYEFAAGGTFAIPRFAYTSGCGIAVIVTITRDASGAATVQISTPTTLEDPLVADALDRIRFSELTLGMDCAGLNKKDSAGKEIKATGGIPIGNTGLLITQVFGTVSLRPDNQFVRLSVTVNTAKKLPLPAPLNKPLVSMKASTTVHIQPEWGLDIAGAIELIGLIEVASGQASVRKDRFNASLTINLLLVSGTGRVDAWTSSGNRFHFTGRGIVQLRVLKGVLYQGCADVPCGVRWCDSPDWLPDHPCGIRHCSVCLSIPPAGFTTGDLGVDLSEFTNEKYGLKGYAVVAGKQYGFYIDEKGIGHFGGVSGYVLATPPALAAARLQQLAVSAAAADQLSLDPQRVDDRYTFLSDREVLIKATIGPAAVAASQGISLVNVAETSDVLFTLSADPGMSMTLLTPTNLEITPANYNSALVAPTYQVKYTETLVYQLERTVDPEEPALARLRFVPASLRADLENVAVRIDGAVVWSGVGLKMPEVRDYALLTPGDHLIEVTAAGGGAVVAAATVNVAAGKEYTLVAAGSETARLLALSDNNEAPTIGTARVRFVQSAQVPGAANIYLNGVPLLANASYSEVSPYATVPAGEVLIEIKDGISSADLAPPRTLNLVDGLVYTLYTIDWDKSGYLMDFGQLLDEVYVGRLFIQYDVARAQTGDWRLKLNGNLATNNYMAAATGIATPTTLANVTVNAADLSQTQVNWTLRSDFAPTKVTVYLTRDPLTQTLTYTDTKGTTATREVTNYTGFAVAEFLISNPAQLQGAPTTQVIDLRNVPSGQYRLWVRADNDEMPPAAAYALAVGAKEVALIDIDHSATFPTTWAAIITPTLTITTLALHVAWDPLPHVDIDFYNVYLGVSSLSYTSVISNVVATALFDEDGNLLAEPFGLAIFDHMSPNLTYYLMVEAVDETDGDVPLRLVRSQEVTISFAAGDYQLGTPQTLYTVTQGASLTIPLTLQVAQPLFFTDVPLGINDADLPPGVLVYFEDEIEGPVVLSTGTTDPADRRANLVVDVAESVPSGRYLLVVNGYNADNLERSHTITLQVGEPSNSIYLPLVERGAP